MKLAYETTTLELAEPLRISRSVMARRDAVQVTIEHEHLRGHGEAVASSYLNLPASTITRLVSEVRPYLERLPDPETALTGFRTITTPWKDLPAGVAGAVEAALLDLIGKRAATSVHRLLGAARPPAAPTARTIGITPAPQAAAQARQLAAAGFSVLKIKAGSPDPADDLARVTAVRDHAPGARLLLDPNGAWTPDQATTLLPRFAALGVVAVEQPIPPGTPEALARLARDSPVPVIADEDAVTYDDALRLAGQVQGINIKLAKCGGVHAALRICDALRGSGTDVMLGCLAASSLGIAPAVHLVHRARWVDLDGHLLLARDPWTGIGGTDGVVRPSTLPGLGVRPANNAG